jgi:hypothetical protein
MMRLNQSGIGRQSELAPSHVKCAERVGETNTARMKMIPMSKLYIEKYYDGDEWGWMVTNAYGDVLLDTYDRTIAEAFVNAS